MFVIYILLFFWYVIFFGYLIFVLIMDIICGLFSKFILIFLLEDVVGLICDLGLYLLFWFDIENLVMILNIFRIILLFIGWDKKYGIDIFSFVGNCFNDWFLFVYESDFEMLDEFSRFLFELIVFWILVRSFFSFCRCLFSVLSCFFFMLLVLFFSLWVMLLIFLCYFLCCFFIFCFNVL